MASMRILLSMALVLGAADVACAQSYPAKPIKLVVGFPAGGATDTTARLIAQRMQTGLGQTIVVDGGLQGTFGPAQGILYALALCDHFGKVAAAHNVAAILAVSGEFNGVGESQHGSHSFAVFARLIEYRDR